MTLFSCIITKIYLLFDSKIAHPQSCSDFPLTLVSVRQLSLALGLSVITLAWLLVKRTNKLPPGPRRLFLIGNLWDLPRNREWLTFTKWSKQYGEIVSLSVMSRSIIILNSVEACSELLQKRFKIYSDRPHWVMCGELMGWERVTGLQPYTARLQQMRRLMHQGLLLDHSSMQENEAAHFLTQVLRNPQKVVEHVKHQVNSSVVKLAYGYTFSENNDPIGTKAEEAMHSFAITTTPGAYLVDSVPWLKYVPAWFPAANFQRQAKEWRNLLFSVVNDSHNLAKAQIQAGTSSPFPSLTSTQLAKQPSPYEEDILKWTTGSMRIAATETTNGAFSTLLLLMAIYPEIQQKAQTEIDNVTGGVRLLKSSDRTSLPYVEAIIKESFRFIPPAPLGVPRLLAQDDYYKGYRLPQGSMILMNIWAMSRNEDHFPEPEKFNPDRYLSTENSFAADPERFIFGYGRRICPGRKFADSTIFMIFSMLLSAFKIENARDAETGEPIQPGVLETTVGTVIEPKPFVCDVSPRSKQAVEMIEEIIAKESSMASS